MAKRYEPAREGWSHPRSHLTRLPKRVPEEHDRYEGVYMVGVFTVVFRVSTQMNAAQRDYRWRGSMGVRGPDGHLLKMGGEQRRAMEAHWDIREEQLCQAYPGGVPEQDRKAFQRKRSEAMNISMALHSNAASEEELKDYISHSAIELCRKHFDTLWKDQLQNGVPGPITLLTAWELLGESFLLRYAGRSMPYQVHIRTSIQNVMAQLSGHSMSLVTPAMVRQCMADLGNDDGVRDRFRWAGRFWDYCAGQKLAAGENPFTAPLKQGLRSVDPEAAARGMSRQVVLTNEEEQTLNEYLLDNWMDPMGRALLLCKEAALDPGELSRLQVRHLTFRERPLRVYAQRARSYVGSATQDYTVPLSPFCACLMKWWYDELSARNQNTDPSDIYVCGPGTEPSAREAIDRQIRRILAGLNIPRENPAQHRYGWNLLRDSLEHRLVTCCGLEEEPGAVSFLMGRSLANDTTSDHYHSFTDPSGQELLYRALARDRRFLCEPAPRLAGEDVYPAQDPRQRNLLELEVAVKAGSTLELSCPFGLSGKLEVMSP